MNDWKTIDTAPKTGKLLCWIGLHDWSIWHRYSDRPWITGFESRFEVRWCCRDHCAKRKIRERKNNGRV